MYPRSGSQTSEETNQLLLFKLEILHEAPRQNTNASLTASQLRNTHWFSLSLLNPALSPSHPNFHRLTEKSSSGNAALHHNTSLLVEMRHSTTASHFDHKPQHYPFSSRSGRYFGSITHSVSCHVLHLPTSSSPAPGSIAV